MLGNIGLASPFRANNLQIQRSHFRGVVKLYFTVLKVTLVLVNNARHLLQCEAGAVPDLSTEISACKT